MSVLWKDFDVLASEDTSLANLTGLVAQRLEIPEDEIYSIVIKKKSLDARHKKRIVYRYQLHLNLRDEVSKLKQFSHLSPVEDKQKVSLFKPGGRGKKLRHKPLIIGSGPAGTFAALSLHELGIESHIIERGQKVESRLRAVNQLRLKGKFDPESNFCFGEGGAGTFSDGKLTCGRNHPLISYIFEKFVSFGAPAAIGFDAHPHIGSDYLVKVAKNMRLHLEGAGTDFTFGKVFTGFRSGGSVARYLVSFSDGDEIATDHLIISIGHSARDTYKRLLEHDLAMVPKPFALGLRIEHPQELINKIQFGSCQMLPAAEYKLSSRFQDRGIWTFCMCPGGYLLPTPAQAGHLAINGMSYHSRKSGFANAAVVVNILREDFYRGHPLDGMKFQESLERKAYEAGGGNYHSPAQRLTDFLAGRASKGTLQSTYKPGVKAARLDNIMPKFVAEALKSAIGSYNQKMHGYLSDEALVVGLESKTSSPISMLRDKSLQSTSHPGIYPCGEGAGFAGGIVSAALDGVKVAQALSAIL